MAHKEQRILVLVADGASPSQATAVWAEFSVVIGNKRWPVIDACVGRSALHDSDFRVHHALRQHTTAVGVQ